MPAPANVFVNYTAALRKPLLVAFGMFNTADSLAFIYSIGSSAPFTPVPLIGTIDGSNAVFTTPTAVTGGCAVFRNGICQDPAISYTLSGSTITFNSQNIPQVGDDLFAIID